MKTLMVIDPDRCSECYDCINACKKEHGVARTKKSSTVPIFCLQCHPEKAPCARICPTGAIKEESGSLVVDEDSCILCRLCMIACPIGILVIDDAKKSVQKCTLCMDSDCLLPACVDACKDNVLKIFSIEDLEDLRNDVDFTEVLEEAMKSYKTKI
ncbi:4Fe-4S dicluster domain-containing protein [Methanobacterium alcaliphilum]|uniref:4Fe-4S dicluster domain-containing protein n=1 Tax=Methanobacterium alcaliphilum TaxID=392018 RepID=UPI00200A4FC5|nr:4Fe-4S dicluster domain-containing protein [Methanobacterium alcaliphilum]MCK9152173.1 4Fe-4S dicluster domain-containing protein [Methanobacterium alcaliphilum]